MDVDSEIFVVRAAQSGSEQAWRRLFERHFDAVYRFCVALADGRRDQAEEVAHQVFVIAARRISHFDAARATFRAWLLGIARNRNAATRDNERRRKRYEQSYAQRNAEVVATDRSDLRVYEALARLPSDYRAVLEAKYMRGLSMKEIAVKGGASVEAVESLLRRARAGFARIYEQMRICRRCSAQGDIMKEMDEDMLLGRHLSGDPPREAFREQVFRDSTAALAGGWRRRPNQVIAQISGG